MVRELMDVSTYLENVKKAKENIGNDRSDGSIYKNLNKVINSFIFIERSKCKLSETEKRELVSAALEVFHAALEAKATRNKYFSETHFWSTVLKMLDKKGMNTPDLLIAISTEFKGCYKYVISNALASLDGVADDFKIDAEGAEEAMKKGITKR